MQPFAQRSRAGWIGVPKWVVIVERVLKDQVKLYRLSADGNEKVFEIATPPSTFGEALMFAEHPRYPLSAAVLRPAELVAVDAADFTAMLRGSVETCFALMADMSQRLHGLIRDLDHLTLHGASCRIAGYLHDHGDDRSGGFELTMPKATLASRLSVTPETLSRIFKELSAQGIIKVRGRQVEIIDPIALELAAGNPPTDPARRPRL